MQMLAAAGCGASEPQEFTASLPAAHVIEPWNPQAAGYSQRIFLGPLLHPDTP